VLTHRRGAYLLKDALFAFDHDWKERQNPRYVVALPVGVPENKYFSVD